MGFALMMSGKVYLSGSIYLSFGGSASVAYLTSAERASPFAHHCGKPQSNISVNLNFVMANAKKRCIAAAMPKRLSADRCRNEEECQRANIFGLSFVEVRFDNEPTISLPEQFWWKLSKLFQRRNNEFAAKFEIAVIISRPSPSTPKRLS